MSIQNHDDHTRYQLSDRPMRADVRHFPKRGNSLFRIVLIWVLIGLALLFAADRWVTQRLSLNRGAPQNARVEPPSAAVASGPRTPSTAGSTTLPANPMTNMRSTASLERPSGPIYRCGNTYGMNPCANGRAVDGPAASGFDSRPSQAMAALVARGRTNATTISDANGSTTTTVTTSSSSGECDGLSGELLHIDVDARQPHPMPYLDRLRARRQQVRDRQAALHC